MERLGDVLILNALAAGALALLAWLASVFVKRPAVVHALWALVLVRLVAPPLLTVPILPTSARAEESLQAQPADGGAPAANGEQAVGPPAEAEATRAASRPLRSGLVPAVALGAAAVAWLALARARRFARAARRGRPATPALAARIDALAGQMGLRRAPAVWLVRARIPPLLWPSRNGTVLVLPELLLTDLADQELDALLVHELAHLHRRDHWFRFVETIATAFFWWYPLTWWARRRLRRAEELCCDEWVLRLLPTAGPHLARGLLKAAALTSEDALPLPLAASAALRTAELRDRLTAALGGPPRPRLDPRLRAALALPAALVLITSPISCRQDDLGELRVDLAVLTGAPGDPLVKYVGLPVKVVSEPSFASHLEAARARRRARLEAQRPDVQTARERSHSELARARAEVERTRSAWLSLPDDAPLKRAAEAAYVGAMRRKDEAVRSAAEVTLGAISAAAVASGRGSVELEFDGLPEPVAEARTGSDGGFAVRIPRRGRFVIAIALPTPGRWSPLGTQSYYWRVSLEGRSAKELLLRGPSGVRGEAPLLVAYRPRS